MGLRADPDRCGKSRPHRDSIPDRPARSQSLYRLSYRAHSYLRLPTLVEELEMNIVVRVHDKVYLGGGKFIASLIL